MQGQLHSVRDPGPRETTGRWAAILEAIPWAAVRQRLGLSPREAEVCRALLAGRSVAGVAFDLGMGVGTVKTHLRRVYRKLDIDSRCDLLLSVLEARERVGSGRSDAG